MQTTLTKNETAVVEFLKMIEERKTTGELNTFYHPDIRQTEYPNGLVKKIIERNLGDLKVGMAKGRKIMDKERYEIKKLYSIDNVVILEAVWKGTLAVSVGSLSPGQQMTAYFAQFFEFRDGKIYRQRNYDCFEPFN